MVNSRSGVPLAAFLTVMNIWVVLQFGVTTWAIWGADPLRRIGILLLAGTASATLCHIWAQVLCLRRFQLNAISALTKPDREGSDV